MIIEYLNLEEGNLLMETIVRTPRKKKQKNVCYNVIDSVSGKPKRLNNLSDYQVMGSAAYCGQLEFARRVIRFKKES